MSALIKCIQVPKTGGSDVLSLVDFPITDVKLAAGQVLVRNSFAGLNFIDTYFRSGLYEKPVPFIPGGEGSGAIVAVGDGVDKEKFLGRRVAYYKSEGSYSSFTVTKAADSFEIPKGVSDEQAAALLLQGCTAHYLTHDSYKVQEGSTVLLHAAAGGTGLLISQICKKFGATVIGTAGSEEKLELARTVGKVDHLINYKENAEWAAEVRKLCPNGVDVVYDGVGKATFDKSLGCLRKRGHMITFGNASGAVDPIAPLTLTKFGSLVLQRPKLYDYEGPDEINQRVSDIFAWLADGSLAVTVGKVFPLKEAKAAHDYLEGRRSTGKILLNCTE